jgi:GNAT superfamily N-acetyltransferase
VTREAPSHYEPLTVTGGERAQIEAQLVANFRLTPAGARAWVDTSLHNGSYFGRKDGERVAASFAAETLDLARDDESRRAALLQSHYVHPDYRGRGYGILRGDLDALVARFHADAVVLSLYDDGLVPYWERRGFVVEQRAEVVGLSHCLERLRRSFHPVFTETYVAEKLQEAAAEGAEVVRTDGIVAVRARGSREVGELLVLDAALAAAHVGATAGMRVALRTIMSYPAAIGLFCPVDV